MNTGKSTNYESVLRMADMNTLEHGRIEQSLIIFFKCLKENGPCYIANVFKPWVTSYNLRSRGLNVEQNSYNSRFFHGLYTYIISRSWNQLPLVVKNAPNVSSFRKHLNKLNFIGCQCSNCLWYYLIYIHRSNVYTFLHKSYILIKLITFWLDQLIKYR